MQGNQGPGELRTFISHSHSCTFSINNEELRYLQSSPHPQAIFLSWHLTPGDTASYGHVQ